MGFGVWGWDLRFAVWGLGFGVLGLGCAVWGLGFGVVGFRVEEREEWRVVKIMFKIWGEGVSPPPLSPVFRVLGLALRLWGSGDNV